MVYNHFRRFLFLRVILLFLNLVLLSWMLVNTAFYVTMTFLAVAALVQTFLLIRYVDVTNDRLTRFFASIRHADFTQVFRSSTEDRSLIALNTEMNAVLDEFRNLRRDREEKELFLQTIVQHVGIGLMVYDAEGKIHLINTACKRLLQLKALLNISELSGPAKDASTLLLHAKGGDSFLFKLHSGAEMFQLSVSVGECVLRERRLRIASIQNIGQDLNKKELEAWHMLTRVLAHEIMNSMTPIISLASSASTILKNHSDEVLPTEDFQDVLEAVNTIARRADGLTAFVDSYRSLTRIPRPVFAEVSVQEVLMDAERLMREKMEQAGVNFVVEKPDAEWHFVIDSGLIGQVLTNLLLNAIDAISEQPSPKIFVRSGCDNQNRLVIQVEDNGKGILKDIQDDIFIPFFTTKRTGSGIGLSLARQIMALHGGTIQVESEPGIRTQFNLRF